MSERASKPPESMTKAQLLDALGRHWTKAQLVSALHAANAGYAPFAVAEEDLANGVYPAWQHPDGGPVSSRVESSGSAPSATWTTSDTTAR